MQKEYGGFIELEHCHGHMLHEDGIKLNSAQNCLRYLIREKGIRTIWLPYFLCESVAEGCRKENTEVKFYHTDETLRPVFPEQIGEDEWMYIVNYYGQLREDEISGYRDRFARLILDNVQAYYHRPAADIPTIYSCRKYFGVADGGILSGIQPSAQEYETDLSFDRMEFLLGRFEKGANAFYSQYVGNNDLVGTLDIKYMSKLTENLLHGIEYDRIREVREENFRTLDEELKEINALALTCPAAPFMYPLMVKNGPELRKKLIGSRIYVPKLWPMDYHSDLIETERRLADNILPIPCDQRYTAEDMRYISSVVHNYLNA